MAAPRALILKAPGTNCDEETAAAWTRAGAEVETRHIARVLEEPAALDSFQILTIPGGFSYGDDLGAGRIFASRLGSALNDALHRFRDRGGLVLGVCNGFQVLTEVGLLPGALMRNEHLRFVSRDIHLRTEETDTPFTSELQRGQILRMPIAHGEGNYFADDALLDELERNRQIIFRYCDAEGRITSEANPNGSARNIAGICNAARNVLGMMPHPERCAEELLGNADGLALFKSIAASFALQ